MYNFGIFLANEAAKVNQQKKRDPENKYSYEVDFSTAIRTARKYFMRAGDKPQIDIVGLISRYVHAVKEQFRVFARPLRGIGAIRFCYR